MNELTIQTGRLRVSVSLDSEGEVWTAAQAAFEAAQTALNDISSRPYVEGKKCPENPVSKAEQVRKIAKRILADGKVHERREIAKAVREAGLNPQIIGRALGESYEKGENVLGRPTYRDVTVPSGYETPEPVPDAEKPAWMRNHRQAEWKEPAGTGTWGSNGVELDGKNGGGGGEPRP